MAISVSLVIPITYRPTNQNLVTYMQPSPAFKVFVIGETAYTKMTISCPSTISLTSGYPLNTTNSSQPTASNHINASCKANISDSPSCQIPCLDCEPCEKQCSNLSEGTAGAYYLCNRPLSVYVIIGFLHIVTHLRLEVELTR